MATVASAMGLVWEGQRGVGGAEGCGYLFKCGQDFLLRPLISLQFVPSASGEGGQTVKITG